MGPVTSWGYRGLKLAALVGLMGGCTYFTDYASTDSPAFLQDKL